MLRWPVALRRPAWGPALGLGLLLAADGARAGDEGGRVCAVRVVGPDAKGNVLDGDPDLPPLVPGAEGLPARRQTELQARGALSGPLPGWWRVVPLARTIFPCPPAEGWRPAAEAERLRGWFADQGWLDAAVAVTAEPWRGRGGARARRAELLRFEVRPGRRYRLTSAQLAVEDALPTDLLDELGALMPRVGRWDGAALRESAEGMRRRLRAAGHPWPQVMHVLIADPEAEDGKALRVEVDAGPVGRFGPVEVLGVDGLHAEALRRAVRPGWRPGDRFDGRAVDRAREALGALPAFAAVEVEAVGGPDPALVPVRVRVLPADDIDWEPIVRVASDATTFSAGAGAAVRGQHLAGRLLRGEAMAAAGWRAFPVFAGIEPTVHNHGPWAEGAAELEAALRPVQGLGLLWAQRGLLDAQRGYNELGGEIEAGLIWRPAAGLRISAAPQLGLWRTFAYDRQLPFYEPWFGGVGSTVPMGGYARPQFRERAVLFGPHLRLAWARGGGPGGAAPGFALALDAEPVGWADGDRFGRGEGKITLSTPLSSRWWLSGRAAAGALRWADGEDVPGVLHLRSFLGGWGSVRGWGYRALSSPGWDGASRDLRIGGDLMGMAGVDLGYRLAPGWELRTFGDVGRTFETLRDARGQSGEVLRGVHLADLQPTVGGGVSLPSPVGSLTVAVAYLLRRDDQLPAYDPFPWAVHIVLGTPP
jgi:hypothetical protein